MKIEENKITFEIDQKTLQAFLGATYLKNQEPDEAFVEMIKFYIYEANKTYIRQSYYFKTNEDTSESKTSSLYMYGGYRDLKSRIDRWILRKSTYFYIIKAFFEVYDNNPDHKVSIEELEERSKLYIGDNEDDQIVSKFKRNFRMICSSKALGQVFVYSKSNNNVELSTEDDLDKYLLSKKVEFLKN